MNAPGRRDRIAGGLIVAILAATVWLSAISPAAHAQSMPLSFGPASVPLNGPWRFHIGDDSSWSDPNFDDSNWETVDLTPQPGAHDGDVGLSNYTAGWSAHGHRGYSGFAWYRLKVRVADLDGSALWLAGPALVDNAYEIYLNGRLMGGIGDLSQDPPRALSIKPRLFALPRALWLAGAGELSAVIAIRVVQVKGISSGTDGGGIHIAPVLGTELAVRDHYRVQWLEKVEGYLVDATEPVLFLLLAITALITRRLDPDDRFYLWIAAVLMLLAATWVNQPLFWLGDFESLRDFVVWRLTIVDALALGAWIMAWYAALDLKRARWIVPACAGFTVLYIVARPLSTPLLWPNLPAAVISVFSIGFKAVRYGFLLLEIAMIVLGFSRKTSWLMLLCIVAGSVSLFGREVHQLGVPGIWFPFGVGVSLSEYANAAFSLTLFIYLLQRLWHVAPAARRRAIVFEADNDES